MKHNPLNNRPYRLLALLIAGALLTLLSMRGKQTRQEQARPFGHMTAQRALSLSEPICQTVATGSGPLTLTAEALPGFDNYWSVACSDAKGHDLLDLDWNADTGELSTVCSGPQLQMRHEGTIMNSAKAVATGRFWLRSLRIGPAPGEWRLRHARFRDSKRYWSLNYTAKGRNVDIDVEAITGILVYAQIVPENGR